MNENRKIQRLLDRLVAKTREKELIWSESFPPGSYMASLPRHSVKIARKDDNEGIVLSMYDEYGRVFDETTATSYGLMNASGPVVGKKLQELFHLVQQSTVKERELDELLQELG